MSILFVLLMFLVIVTVSYFRSPEAFELAARPQPALAPVAKPMMERSSGLAIPQGYCFHPGHTWSLKESADDARIGIDSFAANLIGQIDRVEVIGENRWVRQGQRLMTLHCGKTAIDLVSPIEGVITSINRDALQDPKAIVHDPYEKGWIATMKSPDLPVNQKNLMQGQMVAPWMQNCLTRLTNMVPEMAQAMAADGGLPESGLLTRVTPQVRQNLLQEFFLS
ncbi:MAG: glycine cleavage system protein H [Terriglobales bacterium]|jgi:glycine cleavage system H lipoate-binding protein